MGLGPTDQHLCIFVHEPVTHHHRPLYQYLVEQAHQEGLHGASVFPAKGFGLHRHLHTTRLLDASDDWPVIVGGPEEVRDFFAAVERVVPHRTAERSPGEIVKQRPGDPR